MCAWIWVTMFSCLFYHFSSPSKCHDSGATFDLILRPRIHLSSLKSHSIVWHSILVSPKCVAPYPLNLHWNIHAFPFSLFDLAFANLLEKDWTDFPPAKLFGKCIVLPFQQSRVLYSKWIKRSISLSVWNVSIVQSKWICCGASVIDVINYTSGNLLRL